MRLDAAGLRGKHTQLASLYGERNSQYTLMRSLFNGNFYGEASAPSSTWGSPVQDDKKITYNLINAGVRRYMDEMSAPISVIGVPQGLENRDLELAEARAKLMYEIWQEENMSLKLIQAAYYQSLFDIATFHVRPSPKKRFKVSIELVVPETYLPMPQTDRWDSSRAVMISNVPYASKSSLIDFDPMGNDPKNPLYQAGAVVEHWDSNDFQQFEGGLERLHLNHKWGKVPFVEVHNIPLPHQQRGQGDGDQAVGLNRYLNELITDQANVLTYLAHPIIVIRGSRTGITSLPFGPQAVWEMERDGAVDILTWAGSPPSMEAQIIRVMQAIEDVMGISAPAFGREIPSGVSGETVRSILAGFNTRIGAKQTLMGLALKNLFELIQLILEREFPNEQFTIPGESDSGRSVTIKPKEFKDFHRVQVVFQPQNETVRTFSEIQKVERGVQSRFTTMKRLGIINPRDEERRIREEKRIEMLESMARNGTLPGFQGTGGAQQQLPEFGRAMAQRRPDLQAFTDTAIPELVGELQRGQPGSLADLLGVEGAGDIQGTRTKSVDVEDIAEILREIEPRGRVFLEGDVVESGTSRDRFRIRVENEEDAAEVKESLGALASRADIVVSNEEPEAGLPKLRVGRRRR